MACDVGCSNHAERVVTIFPLPLLPLAASCFGCSCCPLLLVATILIQLLLPLLDQACLELCTHLLLFCELLSLCSHIHKRERLTGSLINEPDDVSIAALLLFCRALLRQILWLHIHPAWAPLFGTNPASMPPRNLGTK